MTLWSDRLVEELLEDVPHRMFTLTIPKRIRPFFLWDRKLLCLLARCASETIRSFYRHILQEPRGMPGIVTSIQTFGNRAANYHPHIHCLAADGLFLPDQAFRSSSFISPVDIAELFRRIVLEAFVNEGLITEGVARNMLSWPHSGFNVHIGSRLLPDDGDSLQTTARYAARAGPAPIRPPDTLALNPMTKQKKTGRQGYNPSAPCTRTPHNLIYDLLTLLAEPSKGQTNTYQDENICYLPDSA